MDRIEEPGGETNSRRTDGIMKKVLPASFFMDAGFFLILAAIPYKVIALGGGPVALGVIPAISSLSYMLLTRVMGPLSDRIERSRMLRYSVLLFIVFAALAFKVDRLGLLMLLMPLLGLSAALFWPAIQALVGDLSRGSHNLETNIGNFNVSWSLGKALGYFTGGMLLAHYDFRTAFLVGIGLAALCFLIQPRPGRRGDPTPFDGGDPVGGDDQTVEPPVAAAPAPTDRRDLPPGEQDIPEPTRQAFRRMAWLANFACFGAGGVLNHQLPKWFQYLNWDEGLFGIFLGVIFFVQTLIFVMLAGRIRFAYSPTRLIIPQLLAGVAMLSLPLINSFALVIPLALMMGISFGVCYTASIFYSLHTDTGKGRNSGIHESLIGAGVFIMPLVGGVLVRLTGRLESPYLLSGAAILAVILIQIVWWRNLKRDQEGTLNRRASSS